MCQVEQNNNTKKTKDQLLDEINHLRNELLLLKGKKENLHNGKLNTFTLLAGGIAHDYNNIFTIICGNLAIAKTCECVDDELLSIFTETETALRRAKDLTEKLRLLSKGSKPEKKPLSIEELIKETVRIILNGSQISCTFLFQKDLWPLKADKIQIERVIQNLILNRIGKQAGKSGSR